MTPTLIFASSEALEVSDGNDDTWRSSAAQNPFLLDEEEQKRFSTPFNPPFFNFICRILNSKNPDQLLFFHDPSFDFSDCDEQKRLTI